MLQQMDSLSISRPGSSYVTHTGHNSPPDTFQTDFTLKNRKNNKNTLYQHAIPTCRVFCTYLICISLKIRHTETISADLLL